jgi:DNA repair protein RadA/Sms
MNRPLAPGTLAIGELGLGGEIRTVSQADRRVAEAANMGIKRVFLAERGMPKRVPKGTELVGVRTIQDALRRLFT